jgi:hypothetical protein
VAACLVGQSSAWGAEDRIGVEYVAADGCPAQQQFEAEIVARTERVRIATTGHSRVFQARISRDQTGYVGRLSAASEQAIADEPRRIVGDSCAEVASALALMIAVAVDPNARTAPVAELSMPAPPVAPPPPKPAPVRVVKPRPIQPAQPDRSLRWGAELNATTHWGLAPNASLGVLGQGHLRIESSDAPGAVNWLARGGLEFAESGLVAGVASQGTIRLAAARLQGCPELRINRKLSVLGCLSFDLGGIWGEGKNVAQPSNKVGLHAAAGPLLEAQWGLGSTWRLGVFVTPMVVVSRSVFVFTEPRVVVHEMPWVIWSAGLGLSYDRPR